MSLSKETLDHIRKEAEGKNPFVEMAHGIAALSLEVPKPVADGIVELWRNVCDDVKKQESAWAVWKEKAEALFKALDAIMQYDQIDVSQISVELRHNAKKALEQFK